MQEEIMTIIGGNEQLATLTRWCYNQPGKVASLLLAAGIDVVTCDRCSGSGKERYCPADSRNDICGSCSGHGCVLQRTLSAS